MSLSLLKTLKRKYQTDSVVCELLEKFSLITTGNKANLDESEVLENLLAHGSSPSDKWDVMYLGLLWLQESLGCGSVIESFMKLQSIIRSLLDHFQSRVRDAAAIVFPIVVDSSLLVNELDWIVSRVQDGMIREESIRPTNLGMINEIPLDDTTGWKFLESDLLALHQLLITLIKKNPQHAADFLRVHCNLIIEQAGSHMNRHVRQLTLQFITNFGDHFSISLHREVVMKTLPVLKSSLMDNWSQIRREGILACKSFFLFLQAYQNEEVLLMEAYKQILPLLCLSRFYIAEGVQVVALEAWKLIMGSNGKYFISQFASETTECYIQMLGAKNHMVVEAASQAITEFVTRLDEENVISFLPALVQALMRCLVADSWPVRDAACCSLGKIFQSYPLDMKLLAHTKLLASFLFYCKKQLQDSIWSVRENAAIAIGDLLKCDVTKTFPEIVDLNLSEKVDLDDLGEGNQPQVVLLFSMKYIRENLLKATITSQRTKSISFLSPKALRLMAASEPVDKKQWNQLKASSWGCCLDCIMENPCDAWEISEGCIYLLREIHQSCITDDSLRNWNNDVLSWLSQLLDYNNHPEMFKLHIAIYEQVS